MVNLTRGSGCKARCTVRASKNMMTIAPTSASIKIINITVKECMSILTAQSLEESFATVRVKAKASSRGPMVVNSSVSGLMIKNSDKVVLNGLTVANIQEDGRANHMEQEFTLTQKKKNFTVNGSMAR